MKLISRARVLALLTDRVPAKVRKAILELPTFSSRKADAKDGLSAEVRQERIAARAQARDP